MPGDAHPNRICWLVGWSLAVLSAAAALAMFDCSASLADTTLASHLPQAPKVSAVGQAFAWSVFEPATDAWRLVVRRSGLTQVPPIAGRSTPFDVDLGDDGRGGLVASYSRCSAPAKSSELPHGCRLYYYDLATGVEHPIAVANARGYSQFDPSMAAGRVAFARIAERGPVGAGNRARIYLQRLAGGKPRRLPGGFENNSPVTGPTALDLSVTALAFAWDAQGATAFEPFSSASSQVSVDDLSGGQTLIALGTGGEISRYEELSPTLAAGTVYYEESGIEEGGELHQLRSLTLPGAHAGVAAAFPGGIAGAFVGVHSTATSSAGTIYSHCAPAALLLSGPSCEVALAEHVEYTDPDQEVVDVARPTTISLSPQVPAQRSPRASGNWLAWSAYDLVGRDYRLMLRGPSGAAKAAPVPPRAVPFDVELGPRSGGGRIAVYSRCRVEPRLDPRDMLPLPQTGRGCRLYRYDIGSPGEHAIPGSGSSFLPSVWNEELAFAKLQPDGTPALYVGSLNGRVVHRLPTGPAGVGRGFGPRALVIHAGRVAFVWEYRTKAGLRSELRLDEPGGRSLLLDSVTSRAGSARELSPSFAGLARGALVWARRQADEESRIEVYGLPGHRLDSYLAPDPIEALATNYFVPLNHIAAGAAIYELGDRQGGASIRHLIAGLATAFRPDVRQLPKPIR